MIIETTLGYIFVGFLFFEALLGIILGLCFTNEAKKRIRAEWKARHYRRHIDDLEAEVYAKDFLISLQNCEVTEDAETTEIRKVSNQ